LALNNNHSPSWQIICNFLTVYLLKLYYLTMIAYLRNKMHKYSNQCNCTSNKRNVLPHSDHTSYIYWISFCEHFLHCWFTPTNMTILYCYNSIYYIISKIFFFFFFFFINVVIKCNCYLYIMEYKIVCKYVERTFVSWNNLCPIQMLYS
jgi:hypothetical protein